MNLSSNNFFERYFEFDCIPSFTATKVFFVPRYALIKLKMVIVLSGVQSHYFNIDYLTLHGYYRIAEAMRFIFKCMILYFQPS